MYLLKIGLSASNDKIKESIDSIEIYAYGTNEEIIRKCNNKTNNINVNIK